MNKISFLNISKAAVAQRLPKTGSRDFSADQAPEAEPSFAGAQRRQTERQRRRPGKIRASVALFIHAHLIQISKSSVHSPLNFPPSVSSIATQLLTKNES